MKKHYALVALLCLAHSLFAQFQWEPTGGPEGLGDFETYYNKDFAFLYDNFQLYRTGDGQSWQVINSTPSGQILVSENRIAIRTEQINGTGNLKDVQILISADNGDTWYNAPAPQQAKFNLNQMMLCTHGIYFKAGEKLYRSQTDGQSWKQVSYDSISFSLLFTSNDIIFGKNNDKIFEFNPQSGKWIHSWNAPPNWYLGAVHKEGDNIVVLGYNFYYASSDRGETWKTFGSNGAFDTKIVKKDGKLFFHSDQLLRYSINEGQNWQSVLLNKNYQKYCLLKDKFLFFSSEFGCVSFDDISNVYTPANAGLNSSPIRSLFASQNYIWAGGVNNVLNKLDTRTQEWTSSELPIEFHQYSTLKTNPAGNLLYHNGHARKFQLSTDYGVSWIPLKPSGVSIIYVDNFGWIDQLIYVDVYPNQYISSDFGATWETVNQRFKSPVIFRNKIWAINENGKIIISSDTARTWIQPDIELDFVTGLVTSNDRIFVISAEIQKVLYSSADGINWEFSGDGLTFNSHGSSRSENLNFWSKNGINYLQQETSIIYSLDSCSTWELVPLSQFYPALVVLNDTIYIGSTNGGGILKSHLPDFGRQSAKGSIFNDLNGNGIKDLNEPNIPGVQVMINTSKYPVKNYFTLSNQYGQFEIRPSFESNDTLRPNILSEYIESIEPPFYITHDSMENYDFAVRFRPNVTDGSITGKFNILPYSGDHLSAHITCFNKGTAPMSGVVGVKLNPGFIYTKSSPIPSEIINSDSLIWHFEDLPVFGRNEILIEGKLSPTLPDGASVSLAGTIHPFGTDVNISDNHFYIPGIFQLSHQPNTKSVLPEDGMTVAEMLEGKELEYTIRFQNPFDHEINSVQISDRLPSDLDYKTIRITGASHEITKWELLPSGILRVFFDNMNLTAASTDHRQSQGYFSFAIRIRKDTYQDFHFTNTANIIFDNIKTITTNTARTRWLEEVISSTEDITSESFQKLSIIPNPASQNCYLSTNGRMKGAGTIRIFNANGQVLSAQQLQDLSLDIEIKTDQLSNGFYLITTEGAEGVMYGKLIIQK